MAADTALHWAGWVGANALAVYASLLAALLLAVGFGWWGLRSQLLPRARRGLPQTAFVLLNGLAGFGIVAGAAALFAEIAEQLGPDLTTGATGTLGTSGTMALADEALTAAIRSHVGMDTLRVFGWLTHFGDVGKLSVLGAVVAVVLLLRRHFALAVGWVIAVGGNALLNPLLKRVFERVRPVHDHGITSELGWSFPSGHSSASTVAYGMLAYLAIRLLPPRWQHLQLPVLLAAAALVFTVGCSRIFLQVHFASDVVAGFASGTAWLVACIVSVELSLNRFRQRPPG